MSWPRICDIRLARFRFCFYRREKKSWKTTNIQIWGDGKDKRTSIQHLRVLFLVLSVARLLDWTFFSLRWGRGFVEHLYFTETREARRRKTHTQKKHWAIINTPWQIKPPAPANLCHTVNSSNPTLWLNHLACGAGAAGNTFPEQCPLPGPASTYHTLSSPSVPAWQVRSTPHEHAVGKQKEKKIDLVWQSKSNKHPDVQTQ